MSIDMVEHIATLERYASECDSVVEMGVRWADNTGSTLALLKGVQVWMLSVDINQIDYERWQVMRDVAHQRGVSWHFENADTTKQTFPGRDLLFIDTLHTYEQLQTELQLHADATTKFIILHDTETFGSRGETGHQPGLQAAVKEFCASSPWNVREHFSNCNGLTILERTK